MDALTAYVVNNYPWLMTDKEKLARRALIAEEKAKKAPAPMAGMLRRSWGTDDPAAIALLEPGPDQFLIAVRDRILRDHADQVTLNRCPQCQAITRTPKARQCFVCGHDWH